MRGAGILNYQPHAAREEMISKEIKDKSKTAVILCLFVRLNNLSVTIRCLEKQTNKDFDLYISNNSNRSLENIHRFFEKNDTSFNVFIRDYKNAYKQFSRFLIARDLAKEGYEKVIFIDDDEVIPSTFIQDCYDQYDKNILKSFYSHKIEQNYWRKRKLLPGEFGNYAGTGGLVCDIKIFLDDRFFNCPEEFYIIDDLWLSHYILKYTEYKIGLLSTGIEFIYDSKATSTKLKQQKQDFADRYIIPFTKD